MLGGVHPTDIPRRSDPIYGAAARRATELTVYVRERRVASSFAAILFDMDGVLVDSMGPIKLRLCEWAAVHGLDAATVLQAAHGRTQLELVREVAPFLDAPREARRLAAREIADIAALRACLGAPSLLRSLPAGSWAIVTSGLRRIAEARLKATRLPMPPVLVTADDVAASKPNPEGYILAAAMLGVESGRCLVLEDAPAGVKAARAAGCHVGGVTGADGQALPGSDFELRDLRELSVDTSPKIGREHPARHLPEMQPATL